jgi:putative NIF3 family GTP cyclohydrolase 1 type 2
VLGGVNDWLAGILAKVTPEAEPEKASVVQPIKVVPQGFDGAGYGRLVQLSAPTELERILQVYCAELGMKHVMVSRPRSATGENKNLIRSVAVCAGSGFDVLKNADADLIVTGEMTHHNALRLKMLGKCVLTVFHSNSERGFLRKVLQPQLQGVLAKEDEAAEVIVSEEDEDPFEIWEAKEVGA